MRSNETPKVKLEYYSEQFAKKLFKRFPQWKQYAGHRVTGEPDNIAYFLEVKVPPVNPKVSEPLHIMTYPQEVIVMWINGVHRHFDDFSRIQPCPDYTDQAIDFLEEIVSEQVVFGYYERNGEPTGAGFSFAVKSNVPPKWLSAEHGSVILRSWLGGHDGELHP